MRRQGLNPACLRGFTLVELIVVIAILGILAVVAMPAFRGASISHNLQAQRVLSDIRFAQELSMATGMRYRWVRSSATTYQIQNQSGVAISLPAGGTQVTLTNGVSFGALGNLPSGLIVFDSQGAPYTDTANPGTALSSVATIPLSASGQTFTIQITPETGYGVIL